MARQLRLAADVLVLAFAVLVTYQGVAILRMAFLNRYVAMDMSTGWSYLAIPVSTFLMIPYILADLIENVKKSA